MLQVMLQCRSTTSMPLSELFSFKILQREFLFLTIAEWFIQVQESWPDLCHLSEKNRFKITLGIASRRRENRVAARYTRHQWCSLTVRDAVAFSRLLLKNSDGWWELPPCLHKKPHTLSSGRAVAMALYSRLAWISWVYYRLYLAELKGIFITSSFDCRLMVMNDKCAC